MPIYEYNCPKCFNVFEEWVKNSEDSESFICPECQNEAFRMISQTTFVLKGSGWYVTEYGNNSKKNTTDNSKNNSTEDSKNNVSPNNTSKSTPKSTEEV